MAFILPQFAAFPCRAQVAPESGRAHQARVHPGVVGLIYLQTETSDGSANAGNFAAWPLIVGNAAALRWRGHELARWPCAGAGTFTFAIAMRLAEIAVCDRSRPAFISRGTSSTGRLSLSF